MKNRVSIALIALFALCILFFVYSMYAARKQSNEVEDGQLKLIVNNFQLENKVVFSNIEAAISMERKLIETNKSDILSGNADFSSLKNLIDISEKVAAIGIMGEDGSEFSISQRKQLYATFQYSGATDSLANYHSWENGIERTVADTLVGNRMYHADIFKQLQSLSKDTIVWRLTTDLPGVEIRKGLSGTTLATDGVTGKKYVISFFVPFKRIMMNTVNNGFQKGEVFLFRSDSLYYNFDGTTDTAAGFDTSSYFVSWKEIANQQHAAAMRVWQTLPNPDSLQIARFTNAGERYCVAFSPIVKNLDGTYFALVTPTSSLPTLLRSQSGTLMIVAMVLLLITGVAITVLYIKKFRKIRFAHLSPDILKQMIAGGENDLLEFKSTIRTNLHAGKPGKEIELAWLKSVVAFCNTEGGTILIGVKDNGEILGLEQDHFQNDDKCLLHIQNLINEHVGLEYLPYIKFSLQQVDDKKILAVQCIALKRIMLLKASGKEQFYVRSGPSSIELPMSKVLEYVNDRKKTF